MTKQMRLEVTLVAVVLALVCCQFMQTSEAQKTAQRWTPQQQSTGSNSQSVYGGYSGGNSAQNFESQKGPSRPISTNYQSSQQVASRPASRPAAPVYQEQQQQQQESSYDSSSSASSAEADAEPALYGAVNGQPGRDFPAYTRVPKTSFSCEGVPYEYGMYADEETGCQAYHLCFNGRKESFLCGVGTVFNQRILHCDYWYSVDCGKSSQYYGSNAYMGSSQPEPGPAEANASPNVQQTSYSSSSSNNQRVSSRPASPSTNYNRQPQQQQQQSSFSRQTQQTQEAY